MKPSEVWKSAAFVLLRLNPKESESLALLFEEPACSNELRMLVLDLLAGAGTFEAQVVMRRLLALQVARRNNRLFATYVQRLGFVTTPDGPTLRFLMSVYAESRGEPNDVRASCAYALGAAAGHALTSGDPDAAVRASDVLRRDLSSAQSAPEKSSLLTALGNAGLPQDVVAIARFVADADVGVRAAAALALRKMTPADARAHLTSLLTDPDVKVSRSALAALTEQQLDDEEIAQIADVVLSGRTSPLLDFRILSLLVAQRPRMTACVARAGAIENALRLLLGRVEAGANEIGSSISGERHALTKESAVMSSGRAWASPASVTQQSAPPSMAPMSRSGSVPAMSAAASSAAADAAARSVPIQGVRPLSEYRLVSPGDSVEVVRERMAQLGLDPNARTSILPEPPPRRATGEHPAMPSMAPRVQPYAHFGGQ
ncbi:MAG: hypothetical protein KF819_28860 [Labilithrix sp.]|nr:hypothetical protein [Labilithrix sp.]